MPEVEFDDADGAEREELLDTETQRRFPPWGLPVAAVLVLVLVIGVVVARHRASDPRAATIAPVAPAASASSSPTSAPPTGTPNIQLDDVYALVGDAPDSRLFALSSDRLYALSPAGRQVGRGATVHLGAASDAQAELALDPARHRIWVVPQSLPGHGDRSPGIVSEFDTRTLRQVGRFVLQLPVFSAAALDGELYLASSGTLYRLEAGTGRSTLLLTTASGELGLVADPSRHRLVYFGDGSPALAGSWSPTGTVRTAPLPLIGGTIVVSGGAIWAGGESRRGGVLVRLDPQTLRAGRNAVRPAKLGSDVSFSGVGSRSLYVYNGSQSDLRISCLDAHTGALLARIGPVDGIFVSLGARGYDGSAPALHQVRMGRCPG